MVAARVMLGVLASKIWLAVGDVIVGVGVM